MKQVFVISDSGLTKEKGYLEKLDHVTGRHLLNPFVNNAIQFATYDEAQATLELVLKDIKMKIKAILPVFLQVEKFFILA